MQPVAPIVTTHLFPETLDALLTLLSGVRDDEWQMPTVCTGWSVKDVALHLLGGDVGLLSRQRDGFRPGGQAVHHWDELVALINGLNRQWVQATQRMSPRLLCDLLAMTGRQVAAYVATLDPFASGGPVSWAGPAAAPVWLDLAREYTERWHHQQHIRDAVNQPGLKAPRYLTPVLETFLHALPHTFRLVPAATGAVVTVTITGHVEHQWHVVRIAEHWQLMTGRAPKPTATVIIDADTAWRLFTKGIDPAAATITSQGEQTLGQQVLHAVSIIA
jgi:uncharacterized protein (TIGR03083 family)